MYRLNEFLACTVGCQREKFNVRGECLTIWRGNLKRFEKGCSD